MPVGHSLSKQYFEQQGFVAADYRLQPMPTLEGLRAWVRREAIAGFNVTAPHKEAIVPLLDALSDEAAAIGAVNCVLVEAGRLTGHNTDAHAFAATLPCGQQWDVAAVLGSGGASRAVCHALRSLQVPLLVASRTPAMHPGTVAYDEVRQALQHAARPLLVNATPVGTTPDTSGCPWPWVDELHAGCTVYDLVYNPRQTTLLRLAAACGAQTQNGLAMLHRQAELSWRLWGLL